MRNLVILLSSNFRDIIDSSIFGDRGEEGVDHGIRISFSALARESAVEEPGVDEHLPDVRVAPVIG